MTLIVPEHILTALVAMAEAQPNEEICGLLLGRHNQVLAHVPASNVADTPQTHFEIDPAALIAAHRDARQGGDQVIGHYHSHPIGKPVPSATDQALARPDGSYWVIIADGVATAWRAGSSGLLAEPILPC